MGVRGSGCQHSVKSESSCPQVNCHAVRGGSEGGGGVRAEMRGGEGRGEGWG